jgi:hypothetical protein
MSNDQLVTACERSCNARPLVDIVCEISARSGQAGLSFESWREFLGLQGCPKASDGGGDYLAAEINYLKAFAERQGPQAVRDGFSVSNVRIFLFLELITTS